MKYVQENGNEAGATGLVIYCLYNRNISMLLLLHIRWGGRQGLKTNLMVWEEGSSVSEDLEFRADSVGSSSVALLTLWKIPRFFE